MIAEPTDVSTARDRIRGYREALEAAGIEVRLELVAASGAINPQSARDGDARSSSTSRAADRDLRRQQRRRSGVAEAARERGLEIPGDLALVCFDDLGQASRIDPFLTVLAQPAETFGTIGDAAAARPARRPRSRSVSASSSCRASSSCARRRASLAALSSAGSGGGRHRRRHSRARRAGGRAPRRPPDPSGAQVASPST